MNDSLKPKYTLNPAVAMQEVQGQVMFLVPGDYDILTLNASGKFIWQALMAGTARADIVKQFAARYRISPEQATRDVNQLVEQLLTKRVLEPSGAPGG